MRLDDKTRAIIKSEVASQLGADAVVRLFTRSYAPTHRLAEGVAQAQAQAMPCHAMWPKKQ